MISALMIVSFCQWLIITASRHYVAASWWTVITIEMQGVTRPWSWASKLKSRSHRSQRCHTSHIISRITLYTSVPTCLQHNHRPARHSNNIATALRLTCLTSTRRWWGTCRLCSLRGRNLHHLMNVSLATPNGHVVLSAIPGTLWARSVRGAEMRHDIDLCCRAWTVTSVYLLTTHGAEQELQFVQQPGCVRKYIVSPFLHIWWNNISPCAFTY